MTLRLTLTFMFWLFGFFLLCEIPSWAKSTGRTEGPRWRGVPRVSVIVPARNEERRISPLLASLRQQTVVPHEVIVVDDHSFDDTMPVAQRMGATVVKSQPLPDGWTGKPWACWQGAQRGSGELFLFLDADTWLESDGLEKIVRAYLSRGGLFTAQPYHVTHELYEQLSAFPNILLMAGTNAFTPLGNRIRPSVSFGPCAICSSEDYFRLGGHQNVRTEVLEDIGMARLFLAHGLPVTCYGGRGAVSFRMYPDGLGELVEGWSKGIGIGALAIRPLFLLMSVAWVSGCFGVSLALIESLVGTPSPVVWLQALFYPLYLLQIHWILKRIGRFQWWTTLLFLIPLFVFALIVLRSFVLVHIMGRVVWKGRRIVTARRRGER